MSVRKSRYQNSNVNTTFVRKGFISLKQALRTSYNEAVQRASTYKGVFPYSYKKMKSRKGTASVTKKQRKDDPLHYTKRFGTDARSVSRDRSVHEPDSISQPSPSGMLKIPRKSRCVDAAKEEATAQPPESNAKEEDIAQSPESNIKEEDTTQSSESNIKEEDTTQSLESNTKEEDTPQSLESNTKEEEAAQSLESNTKGEEAAQSPDSCAKADTKTLFLMSLSLARMHAFCCNQKYIKPPCISAITQFHLCSQRCK